MKLSRVNTCIIPTLLMLLMVLLDSASTRAQETEEAVDEREFDYMRGSEKGPHYWGELKKEWSACKHGHMQSPIDLSCARVKIIPRCQQLYTDYFSSNATIINRGHDVAVTTSFFLFFFPLKIFLLPSQSWLKHCLTLVDEEVEREIGETNPSGIQTRGNMYYRYLGSLTTPPCTEGVIWNIDRKIRTVSEAQVRLLREAVHDHAQRNSRPRQPRNQRDVLYFRFKSRAKSNK